MNGGESLCMLCGTSFPDEVDHKCPPHIQVENWAREIRDIAQARGRGLGRKAALAHAKRYRPKITTADFSRIVDGTIELSEIYAWFSVKPPSEARK